MTATYIPTSQVAKAPDSIFWLEKESKSGRTTIDDIKDALDEYERSFTSGNASKAEIMTLHRAFPDSPTYTEAATKLQKADMVDPMVIGGPASVELIDREGHLITTGALDRAFQKFMDSHRTRNVMVLHSDVQVGWALPAYISKGGQIFKSGVDDKGLFFICELRDDTAISKKVADQINQGLLKSYSIAGSATKIQNMKKGLTPYMQVDEMELAEVTVCEKGVNQGANFEILKAELPQTGKIDKDQCGYRDATAPEEKMGINCGHCKYFNAEQRTCDVVVGDIMPGDYCKLFEACEEDTTPHATVHRKIVIMRSDNTGRINFKDSFMDWMSKEEDPLKSGKSFATLNNFAGREAEHHRLLQEYGFPSEVPIDSMRYTPVVETETDDDGKPINIIPPWVVNEAGQSLGDKLDEDAPSFKKSIDIFEEIIQKATKRMGKANGTTNPVPQEDPKKFQESLNITPATQPGPGGMTGAFGGGYPAGSGSFERPQTDQSRSAAGLGQPGKPGGDYGTQPAKFRGERKFTPEPEKRPGLLQRLGNQIGERSKATPTSAPQGRDAEGLRQDYPSRTRSIVERGRERIGAGAKRMGALFSAGKKRLEGIDIPLDRGARKIGRGIAEGTRRAVAGAREFGSGAKEGFQSYDPKTAKFDEIRSGGGRRDEQGRLRRTGEGRRGQLAGNRSAARRVGQLFGAGGRGAAESSMQGAGLAAEGAFRGARELGRGARGFARGAAPGKTGQRWRGREQGDDAGSDRKRGATERFGQWLGERGRERAAATADATGQTTRGFGRGLAPGEWGKRLRAKDAASGKERTFGEKLGQVVGTGTRGAGRWGANIPTQAGRKAPKYGSQARQEAHMMQNEGVGGGQRFSPAAHRNLSPEQAHQSVGNLVSGINEGKNLSPKQWMEAIHYLSSDRESGQRNADFDVNMNSKDWNTPMSIGDMKQMFGDKIQTSFGERGGKGQRAFDKLIGQLESAGSTGGKKIEWDKIKTPDKRTEEAEEPDDYRSHLDTDEDQPSQQPPNRRNRRKITTRELLERRKENRRKKDMEEKPASEGWGPNPMDMSWDDEKPSVHKVFAKAFGLTKARR